MSHCPVNCHVESRTTWRAPLAGQSPKQVDYGQCSVKSEPQDKNIQPLVLKSVNAAEVRGHSSGNTSAALCSPSEKASRDCCGFEMDVVYRTGCLVLMPKMHFFVWHTAMMTSFVTEDDEVEDEARFHHTKISDLLPQRDWFPLKLISRRTHLHFIFSAI